MQVELEGPRLRRALEGIPVYVPGRRAVGPDGEGPAYKLSSNENPYPPLPSVLGVLANSVTAINRYPDLGAERLVAALAERLDVPTDHIATGTGAVGLLQQLVQSTAGPGDEVLYAWRSFEIYPIVVQVAGAASVRVPLRDERHDLDAMATAITERTRLIIICNPNNPTSTIVHRTELERFLDRVPPDVLVVMDEAYVEFARDPELPDSLELYRERPNVAVLRTFSKAYGLAGLRVGYAVARSAVTDALRKTAVPFGVSQLAQDAAVASLQAEDELFERCELLVKERERVVDVLRGQGWTVPECEANFVWLRLGDRTPAFAAACEAAGIMVRPYPPDGVRASVGEEEANELFLGVAAEFA